MTQAEVSPSEIISSDGQVRAVDLRGWFPVDAIIHEGRPAIEWMNFGNIDLVEPFFTETVARLESDGVGQRVVTDINFLLPFENEIDSLEPTGFIFHVSRCGSTMVVNACRKVKESIVIAEAPVLDKIISRFLTDAEPDSPKEMVYMVLLRAAVKAFGQRRTGNERHLIIKFACTSSLQIARLRRIWPAVPFLFIYRDPVEVMVSNLIIPPEWLRIESNPATAAAIAGITTQELANVSVEEFCAMAVGRFLGEGLRNQGHIRLLDYATLSPEMLLSVAEYLGMAPNTEEVSNITQGFQIYSKDPKQSRVFYSDGVSKRAAATLHSLEMAEKWASPVYRELIRTTRAI